MTTIRTALFEVYPNVEWYGFNNNQIKDGSNLMELTTASAAASQTRSRKNNSKLQEHGRSSCCTRQTKATVVDFPEDNDQVPNHLQSSSRSLLSSSSSSSNSKKKKEKKSVCFNNRKSVRKIPHLSSMSKRIKTNCWYMTDDFENMEQEYHVLLFFMNRGDSENIDEEYESTRGLEYKTDEGTWQRFQNRRRAYDAVLDEQERQWIEDEEDQSMIAERYIESNKISTEIALEVAKKDQEAVQEYLLDISRHATWSGRGSDVVVRGSINNKSRDYYPSALTKFHATTTTTDDIISGGEGNDYRRISKNNNGPTRNSLRVSVQRQRGI